MSLTTLLKVASPAVLAVAFAAACTSKTPPPAGPVSNDDVGTVPAQTAVGDSDGDGVTDDLDLCPGTPAGVAVDASGCELDSDNDGVVDSIDECPDSRPGAVVDDRGCEVILELPDAYFDFDKSNLKPEGVADLTAAAETLINNPNLNIEVAGHTDSIGTEQYNDGLGARRAETVANFLASKGVDAGRMAVRSYGESKPVATNSTREGRALNRRVELIIQ